MLFDLFTILKNLHHRQMKTEEAIIREKTPSPHSKLPALFKIIRLNGTYYHEKLSLYVLYL